MNILVCVKQVPDAQEVKIDPVTHRLIRDSAPAIMNPLDACALEAALSQKDNNPTSVDVTLLCMGPEAAIAMLRDGLAAGADHAYLVSGRFAAGSDTLATSYILSRAIRYLEKTQNKSFDLILAGKYATDGDTAQVGPQLAEHLGLGQITCATAFSVEGDTVTATQEADNRRNLLQADMPCVVTVAKTVHPLRPATLKRRMAVKNAEIPVIDQDALQELLDLTRCGLSGSPTVVHSSFSPEKKKGCLFISEATNVASAIKLVTILSGENRI